MEPASPGPRLIMPPPLSLLPCRRATEANKIEAAKFGTIHSLARMLEAPEAPLMQEAAAAALANLAANSGEAQALIASAGGAAARWRLHCALVGRTPPPVTDLGTAQQKREIYGLLRRACSRARCAHLAAACRRYPAACGGAAERHPGCQAACNTRRPQLGWAGAVGRARTPVAPQVAQCNWRHVIVGDAGCWHVELA